MHNEIGKIYERPWGTYQTLTLSKGYQVKIITVNPGELLSLQKHLNRDEHWIVVEGRPLLTLGCLTQTYRVGETMYIPKGEMHRIINDTSKPVKIIEVQIGDYLGEDDIVRIEDVYGREVEK